MRTKFRSEAGLAFFAGYLIEKSLSVDNIFVFLMIFSYFGIEARYQRRVLTWGILGAIVLRAIFIFAGVAILDAFHWMLYVFGAFLIFTAIRMAIQDEEAMDPTQNPIIKLVQRFIPVTDEFDGEKFFTMSAGKRVATPLFVTLIMIELSDVIFAVDSIPAILAITTDPFLVYSSNPGRNHGHVPLFAVWASNNFRLCRHQNDLERFLPYANRTGTGCDSRCPSRLGCCIADLA